MHPRIEADGETWEARMDRFDPHPGIHAIVFSCVSNPQHPYHVVEVPAEEVADAERLGRLPRERLAALFADSDPLDVVHDPEADPLHPGGHPLPPASPGVGERDRG
jgi:hypothetical protein